MTHTTLQIGQLELSLSLPGPRADLALDPYEDWRTCQMKARVGSFTGSFIWQVMSSELLQLADDLSSLYERFPATGTVAFEGVEPNVSMSFTIGDRGEVRVHFKLSDQPLDWLDSITLAGSVETDQQMLVDVANKLRRLVQSSNDAAVDSNT
jgi:hypothetical protein